jgi:uncharacterized protein (TIGR03435 family)
MKIRILLAVNLFVFLHFLSFAQSGGNVSSGNGATPATASGLRFEAAHVDRNKLAPIPMMSGPAREGDRYVIYAHSMEALISNAYGVPENNIVGGPSWLSFDRYDIDAKTPMTTSDADVRLMLKAQLEERFHLAIHKGTTSTPVRALYLEKGASKLKASDDKEDASCKPQFSAAGGPPMITFDCHNQTMDGLGQLLNGIAGYQDKRPVIDKTGLKGGFDFKLSWTPDGPARAMAGAGAVSLTDALSEIGLKITSETAPREALLVDSVDEEPAPDPPDTAKLLPPRPLPEFDVSVIKPFDPGSQRRGMIGNSRIDVNGMPLTVLIKTAWGLNYPNFIDIANPPAWLDKDLWSIEAKVSSNQPGATGNKPQQLDYPQFQLMIRALLAERFHLQAHMEEREGNAYDLVAVNPKLTPVDPSIPPNDPRLRETCAAVPGPDGVDPRKKNPALDRLLYCQNTTTEHMAEGMEGQQGGDVHLKVFDKTGLKGRYNYTLSFSSMFNLPGNGIGPPPGAASGSPSESSASDPTGAVPLSEALKTELGLKLVKTKELVPVLVIDHIDETPTPN